ncbi:MAG: hypothetical protein GMKNLPBB_02903 [Myxococcota bacterium]|nr:hypothetical protein [Myxococcota bacterium]
MKTNFRTRHVRFTVLDGCLVREVVDQASNKTYRHRCAKRTFETVVHAMSEITSEGEGTTLTQIARQERLPCTQVNVALEFLKDRGVVDVRHRRSYPSGSPTFFEDAMIEFHYLADATD